ncbi:hypothetical protein GLA29479_2043 [Lysobacter antibioticus]|uniref:hypothetical protein n=1 Tax=Lysobacter antibioticus TaxID=84531 RepID=UPI0007170FAF|nr:hypothetical protein [Lysobacter antibioticus]ALN62914.1 hypothetical protein GLA29479_2043 [Lysobacter antibioticus]
MQNDDPADHYPLYPLGMLRRHGLADAQDLAERLPSWSESELREAFWPAYRAIRVTETELERCGGIDGGERVLQLNGQPIFVSEDIWNFQVRAGAELMAALVAALERQRAASPDIATP